MIGNILKSLPGLILICAACGPGGAGKEGAPATFETWTVPPEVRLYRGAFSRQPDNRALKLEGLAGEVLSAQVAVRSGRDIDSLSGKFSDLAGALRRLYPGR